MNKCNKVSALAQSIEGLRERTRSADTSFLVNHIFNHASRLGERVTIVTLYE